MAMLSATSAGLSSKPLHSRRYQVHTVKTSVLVLDSQSRGRSTTFGQHGILLETFLTLILWLATAGGKKVTIKEVDVNLVFNDFEHLYEQVTEHLSTEPNLYTQDGAAGSFKDDRTRVRV